MIAPFLGAAGSSTHHPFHFISFYRGGRPFGILGAILMDPRHEIERPVKIVGQLRGTCSLDEDSASVVLK